MSEVVNGYWEHYRLAPAPSDRGTQAWEAVEDMAHGRRGAADWDPLDLIEALAAAAPSSDALAYLGAGPVEDLLHRPDAHLFVDRVDQLARRHSRFRYALGSAYFDEGLTTSEGVTLQRWQRWHRGGRSSE